MSSQASFFPQPANTPSTGAGRHRAQGLREDAQPSDVFAALLGAGIARFERSSPLQGIGGGGPSAGEQPESGHGATVRLDALARAELASGRGMPSPDSTRQRAATHAANELQRPGESPVAQQASAASKQPSTTAQADRPGGETPSHEPARMSTPARANQVDAPTADPSRTDQADAQGRTSREVPAWMRQADRPNASPMQRAGSEVSRVGGVQSMAGTGSSERGGAGRVTGTPGVAMREGPQPRTTEQAGSRGGRAEQQGAASRQQVLQADAERFQAQLSRGLASALRQVGGQVLLRLQPEAMGMVRVQLDVDQGSVTARFEATTEQARQLLDSNLAALRQSLEARGLQVERLHVQGPTPGPGNEQAEPRSGSDLGREQEATRGGEDGRDASHGRDAAHQGAGTAPHGPGGTPGGQDEAESPPEAGLAGEPLVSYGPGGVVRLDAIA